jgi:hypothetical protein
MHFAGYELSESLRHDSQACIPRCHVLLVQFPDNTLESEMNTISQITLISSPSNDLGKSACMTYLSGMRMSRATKGDNGLTVRPPCQFYGIQTIGTSVEMLTHPNPNAIVAQTTSTAEESASHSFNVASSVLRL